MASDTVVKMSLEAFCKENILVDGGESLLAVLRAKALQMNDVLFETYHLILFTFSGAV